MSKKIKTKFIYDHKNHSGKFSRDQTFHQRATRTGFRGMDAAGGKDEMVRRRTLHVPFRRGGCSGRWPMADPDEVGSHGRDGILRRLSLCETAGETGLYLVLEKSSAAGLG